MQLFAGIYHMRAQAGLIMLCFLLQSCAWFDNAPQEESTMSIIVDFQDVHRCSRISPEITVINPPDGTSYFDVRLIEEGKMERLLGGGTWRADTGNQIPEGGLTQHYMGPCPPTGSNITYTYIVSAMNDGNPQPLEVRIFHVTPDE